MCEDRPRRRSCICIDLKSYYASVECVARGLDPLSARLLVADETRSDQTICLAVSPALKAMGVPSRPRLFEAKQAIRLYDAAHHTQTQFYIAPPRMAEYICTTSLRRISTSTALTKPSSTAPATLPATNSRPGSRASVPPISWRAP